MGKNNDTILIEIAAYCDPELLNTINSALIQAENPDRIHFAICYQSDNMDDYNELKKIKNCKIEYMKERDARGSAYARYLCQKLISDEKYIYQIDSHMRFVKHWDTKIIEQLESLNDKKAILSVYPPYCTEDMMSLSLDDPIYDNPAKGGVMHTTGFREGDTYFLSCNSIPIEKTDYRAYKKNAFIAAGNFFTYSDAHREVLHDIEMYFYGDELPMSIRLFTYGWNVYNPGESFVYHQYERKNQKFPSVKNAMKNEDERLKKLLDIKCDSKELGEFGLGNVRTLKEYEDFSGIDFKNKIIYMIAENGEFENNDMKKKLSYLQQKNSEKYKFENNSESIEVVIVDYFNEYKKCIESCLAKASNPKNISFLVITRDKNEAEEEYCYVNNVKKIIYLKEHVNYTKALSMITEYLGDGFVLIVDSSVRFVNKWDKNYCKNLILCGDNSALTSWVWYSSKEKDADNFYDYCNIVKEFFDFKDFLPILHYNESIDLSKRIFPYQTAFISDGFLFCKASVIKKIPIDPNLTYEEHQYIYSVRLWTNGINLYYPSYSYVLRTKKEMLLNEGNKNKKIVCGLMGINNYFSKKFLADYEYDLGNIRPLWTWYEYIKVKYDPVKMQIDEKKY